LPESRLSKTVLSQATETQDRKEFSILLPERKFLIDFTFVDVGNPVACIFVEDFDTLDWRGIGQEMKILQTFFPKNKRRFHKNR
jgi:hypothetical protein